VSNLIRNPQGRFAQRIEIIEASPLLTAQVEAVLGAIDTLPFDHAHSSSWLALRSVGSDLIIAAQAVTLDLALATDNDQEILRIGGLRVDRKLAQGLVSSCPVDNAWIGSGSVSWGSHPIDFVDVGLC
jgi:hypothetical protein